MKKLLFFCLLFFSYTSQAQLLDPSQVHPQEAMISYDGQEVPGYTVEAPFSPDLVEDAMKDRFKKMDVKGKERKDFWEYKNVVIPEIREDHVDAYIKIDRKSKKEKNISIVSLVLTEPGIAPGASDSVVAAARGVKAPIAAFGAFGLLASLNGHTEGRSTELDIKSQGDELKKAEKKNKELIEDGEDLQKKLKNIQDDISDNKKKQAKQQAELNKQQELFLNAQAKRKIIPASTGN
jgi:hypothetical protein